MKKIFSVFMTVVFALSAVACLPASAYSHTEYDSEYNGFWISNPTDYSVKIVDYTGYETDIVIPDEIYGQKVTAIGRMAFWHNENITSVKLPSCLEEIEESAFNSCVNLTEIEIPKSLKKCNAPFNGSGIVTATIEDGATEIPDDLFCGCKKLENVSIPDTVTKIGDNVFTGCSALEELKLPSNLTTLMGAFTGCSGLKSITIPKSLNHVVNSPFSWSGLESAVLEDGMTTVPDELFYCADKLTDVVIPETVTTINRHAFSHCSSLETISLPSNLKILGNSVFRNCRSLNSITIPNTLESIGDTAFEYCTSLRTITIPASVTSMGNGIFINIGENFVIWCYRGSVAYDYALKNNIKFGVIKEYKSGDVNLDGTVNVSDATLLQKYIADIETLSDEQSKVSDVNGDGTISVYDVTEIQKIAVSS